ncbi:MAG: MarR family transcriptional regulator [Anaerolineales bacterium]|jgi:DNA-binding MarR family transcriptional regulator|uniref:MarR family winged helix-turn-helix transcriptional regulator n=1 Tax=Candidatus Villigracilis vicinus TaxID=3140679 RepID=UPI0031374023|nr:MarR family transcriptional regulator [Anaerolineales bacterium]MBK7452040.1 MarR family transcriptional regulator [Anaerolineales bacterium]MBK9780429.1 MarR family transcriptional regulator [Anaerolineales bacterium]
MTSPIQLKQTLHTWMDVFMHRSMRSWTQFAKTTGLSMPQFSILMQLHHKGPCGMSEISERFDITAAAASQLTEKLVQGGYIERTEDPNDRRAKSIQLTPKGKDLVEAGMTERYRWMDELISKLSVEDKPKVVEALKVLTEAAKQLEEKA